MRRAPTAELVTAAGRTAPFLTWPEDPDRTATPTVGGTSDVALTETLLASILRGVVPRVAEEDILSSLDAIDEAFVRMSAVRDADGGIVDFEYEFCNRAALGLLRRRREEVLGRRLLDLANERE
jgi:PAS domain-containing protein